MQQLNLTDARFNGSDYNRKRDDARLKGQIFDIFKLMQDGTWRTLKQISSLTGHPEASVSAQLRHLRKPRFGKHSVQKVYIAQGLYKYRLCVNGGQYNG